MHLLYENWNDGDQLLRGKRQLNRDTWEQAQRENSATPVCALLTVMTSMIL